MDCLDAWDDFCGFDDVAGSPLRADDEGAEADVDCFDDLDFFDDLDCVDDFDNFDRFDEVARPRFGADATVESESDEEDVISACFRFLVAGAAWRLVEPADREDSVVAEFRGCDKSDRGSGVG